MLNKKTVVGALATLVLLPAVLVGCSSGPDASSKPTSTAQSTDRTELSSKINACMREKGYDVEDAPESKNSSQIEVPAGADPERYNADLEACGDKVDPGSAGQGAQEVDPTAQQKAAFGKCMRDNGFPDYSDDGDDPKGSEAEGFEKTFSACASKALTPEDTEK